MSMKAYENLKGMLCKELEEITEKGELSAGDLETAHKLTDTIKNVLKIEMYEDEGYSSDGGWRAEGSYSRGYDYDGGNSYARRGTHYVRGHYSRGNGGRYSMDDGREMMMDRMNEMMNDQSLSAGDRRVIREAMEKLQK